MPVRIEKRAGVDHVVHDDLDGWARPATPDESELWAHGKALEQQLAGANATIAHFLGPEGDKHVDKFANQVERMASWEQALREIAGVVAPLDSLEINHRYAVECARAALGK